MDRLIERPKFDVKSGRPSRPTSELDPKREPFRRRTVGRPVVAFGPDLQLKGGRWEGVAEEERGREVFAALQSEPRSA